MRKLYVDLYGHNLGSLIQDTSGFDFHVNTDIFKHFEPLSTILSIAIPLTLAYTRTHKARRANFFAELLPEDRNLTWLAQMARLPENDVFGLLEKFGRDVAGATVIYNPEKPTERRPSCTKVDARDIRELLENTPKTPLANSPLSGKTSLGGVQTKIVLAKLSGKWNRVRDGYPSTHIVKPAVPEYKTLIYDEAFCMALAKQVNLTSYQVSVENFDGVDALVIERYDRSANAAENRIHQEDFNQALGASGIQKYQEYGGKISFMRIAKAIETYSDAKSVIHLAEQMIFAVAIGNLDMHAKNISILHYPDEKIALAPAYDQVPLRHQNTDGRMALSIGGEYVHHAITCAALADELLAWKSASFQNREATHAFIIDKLEAIEKALYSTPIHPNAYPALQEEIHRFIKNLISGKPVG